MKPVTLADVDAQLTAAIINGDQSEIEWLAHLADRLASRPAPVKGDAALWYAAQGLRVFPLKALEKVPWAGSRGCKDATADAARIQAWWTDQPDANVAIATGHLVDVIDIDGPAGVRTWLGMDDLPPILGKVSTPRAGGIHLYIGADPARGNRANWLPGMDIRAQGGYVVAPPSATPQGSYVWFRPLMLP